LAWGKWLAPARTACGFRSRRTLVRAQCHIEEQAAEWIDDNRDLVDEWLQFALDNADNTEEAEYSPTFGRVPPPWLLPYRTM